MQLPFILQLRVVLQRAGLKQPKISQLSLDYDSGVKQLKQSQLSLVSELLFSFLHASLIVVTLKTKHKGSSLCTNLVHNIISTYAKNNLVSTKYKSNPKKASKQATRSNQVIDLQPLPDPNCIHLLLTHYNLPEDFATEFIKPTAYLPSVCTLGQFITTLLKTTDFFFWL
jgi:hypothetical protein